MKHFGLLTNPRLILEIATSIGLQVAAVYKPFLQHAVKRTPLSLQDWGILVVVARHFCGV